MTKSKSYPASSSTRREQKGLEDEDGDSDLEPLSSLTQPTLSAKEASPGGTSLSRNDNQNNKLEPDAASASSPKKKLFRARTSAPGFYEEVHLDDEERDDQLAAAAAAAGRGSRTRSAVRWSDVSIIDLT